MANASNKQSKRRGNFGELESQTSPEQGETQKRQWSRHSTGNQSADGGVGNAADAGQPQRGRGTMGQPEQKPQPKRSDSNSDNTECETQPALGGNPDGSAGGMDYAELCITCDNRTDELRLLGNGVVPATATLAFRTLLQEIISA
jgi:hypothetical protein